MKRFSVQKVLVFFLDHEHCIKDNYTYRVKFHTCTYTTVHDKGGTYFLQVLSLRMHLILC